MRRLAISELTAAFDALYALRIGVNGTLRGEARDAAACVRDPGVEATEGCDRSRGEADVVFALGDVGRNRERTITETSGEGREGFGAARREYDPGAAGVADLGELLAEALRRAGDHDDLVQIGRASCRERV